MTTTSSSSPQQNPRESWVGLCNIDDLSDIIERAGLEGDVFQPDRHNIPVGNPERLYPGADGRPFNPNTHETKVSEKWDLLSHSSGFHVDKIWCDIGTRDRILFNLPTSCSKVLAVMTTTTCQFTSA